MRRTWQKIIIGTTALMILALIFAALPACAPTYTAENPLVLDYESWLPTATPSYPVAEEWAKGLEEATGGAVKVEFHMGGAMGPGPETYGRVTAGISDIGHFAPGYIPGTFPTFEIWELPIVFDSGEKFTRAMLKMWDAGWFDKDFADVKLIRMYSIAPYVLFSKVKATSIAELKGLKLRCPSAGWVEMTKALGGVPVSMSSAEVYLAMQKGIVDGVWNPGDGVFVYKFQEVGKYYINIGLSTTVLLHVMNKDVFEEIPKAGRDYIETTWQQYCVETGKAYDVTMAASKDAFLTMDGLADREVLGFAPAEYEKMDALFAPIWTNWIANRKAKGIEAEKAISDFYKYFREVGVENPFVGYTPAG